MSDTPVHGKPVWLGHKLRRTGRIKPSGDISDFHRVDIYADELGSGSGGLRDASTTKGRSFSIGGETHVKTKGKLERPLRRKSRFLLPADGISDIDDVDVHQDESPSGSKYASTTDGRRFSMESQPRGTTEGELERPLRRKARFLQTTDDEVDIHSVDLRQRNSRSGGLLFAETGEGRKYFVGSQPHGKMGDKLARLKAKASEDVERTERGSWHLFLDEPHDEISTPTLARFFRESEDSAKRPSVAVGEDVVADEAVTDKERAEIATGIHLGFGDKMNAMPANDLDELPLHEVTDENNVAWVDFADQEMEESREEAAEEGREEDEDEEIAEGENYEEDNDDEEEENEGYHSKDAEKAIKEVMGSDPEMTTMEARKHAEEVAEGASENPAEEGTEHAPELTQKVVAQEKVPEPTKKATDKPVEQRIAVDVQPDGISAAAAAAAAEEEEEEDDDDAEAEAENSDDAFESMSIELEEELVTGSMAKPASSTAPVEEALAEPAAGASIEEAATGNDIKSALSLTEQAGEFTITIHSDESATKLVAEDTIDFATSPGALEPVDWFRSIPTNKTARSFIIESDSDLEEMERNSAESEFKVRRRFPLPIGNGEKPNDSFRDHFEDKEEYKAPPENQDLPSEPFPNEDTYEDYIYHGFCAITVGDVIAGRYQVFHKIGAGGHGTVWLVHDRELSKWRALKVLSTPKSEEHCPDRRFDRLVKKKGLTVEELERRHITFPYDMFELEMSPRRKNLCLVMPLMGPDLLSIRQWESLEMRRIFYELAGSLEFLHQNNICHGDYRTSNLLLCLDQDDLHSITIEQMENRLPKPLTRKSDNVVFFANHPYVPESFTKKTDLEWLGVKFTGHAAVVDFGGAHEVPDPGAWAGIPATWAAPEAYWQLSASLPADVWALATTIAEVYTDTRLFSGNPDDECMAAEYEFTLGSLPQPYRKACRKRVRKIRAIELGEAQELGHDQKLKSGQVYGTPPDVEKIDAASVPGTVPDEHLDDVEDCSKPLSMSEEDLLELRQNTFAGDKKQSSIIRSVISLPWTFQLAHPDFPYQELTTENHESLLEKYPSFEVGGSMEQTELDMLGDLLERVLRYQPEDRITISEVLKHEWFAYTGEVQTVDEDGVVEDNAIKDNAAEHTIDGAIEEPIDELIEDYSVKNNILEDDDEVENDSQDQTKDDIEDEIVAKTNTSAQNSEQDTARSNVESIAAENYIEGKVAEDKATVEDDAVGNDVAKDAGAIENDSKEEVKEEVEELKDDVVDDVVAEKNIEDTGVEEKEHVVESEVEDDFENGVKDIAKDDAKNNSEDDNLKDDVENGAKEEIIEDDEVENSTKGNDDKDVVEGDIFVKHDGAEQIDTEISGTLEEEIEDDAIKKTNTKPESDDDAAEKTIPEPDKMIREPSEDDADIKNDAEPDETIKEAAKDDAVEITDTDANREIRETAEEDMATKADTSPGRSSRDTVEYNTVKKPETKTDAVPETHGLDTKAEKAQLVERPSQNENQVRHQSQHGRSRDSNAVSTRPKRTLQVIESSLKDTLSAITPIDDSTDPMLSLLFGMVLATALWLPVAIAFYLAQRQQRQQQLNDSIILLSPRDHRRGL